MLICMFHTFPDLEIYKIKFFTFPCLHRNPVYISHSILKDYIYSIFSLNIQIIKSTQSPNAEHNQYYTKLNQK